jgi:hypothetical protein
LGKKGLKSACLHFSTLAVEPTVRVVDETSGERVHNYELEPMVNADLELVRNRLYAGFNLLYKPEYTHTLTNRRLGTSAEC